MLICDMHILVEELKGMKSYVFVPSIEIFIGQ